MQSQLVSAHGMLAILEVLESRTSRDVTLKLLQIINAVSIFKDAQKTTASHRKLVVNLRKIHESCCYEPTRPQKPAAAAPAEDFDEDDFNAEFSRCVMRAMPVKKSESVGEKTIRFVGLFLRHASDKDNEMLGEDDADASTMPETPSSRLTTEVMEAVLPLLFSKDKFVRYRSTQLISHIINSLDAIDDDLFQKLRRGLLRTQYAVPKGPQPEVPTAVEESGLDCADMPDPGREPAPGNPDGLRAGLLAAVSALRGTPRHGPRRWLGRGLARGAQARGPQLAAMSGVRGGEEDA